MTITAESWTPGIPIHDRPAGLNRNQQVVRPIFQVLTDATLRSNSQPLGLAALSFCAACLVYWSYPGTGGATECWMCGKEATRL